MFVSIFQGIVDFVRAPATFSGHQLPRLLRCGGRWRTVVESHKRFRQVQLLLFLHYDWSRRIRKHLHNTTTINTIAHTNLQKVFDGLSLGNLLKIVGIALLDARVAGDEELRYVTVALLAGPVQGCVAVLCCCCGGGVDNENSD